MLRISMPYTSMHMSTQVPLDGDLEIYEQLAMRRFTGESARLARTWEWATLTESDLAQVVMCARIKQSYMHACIHTCMQS